MPYLQQRLQAATMRQVKSMVQVMTTVRVFPTYNKVKTRMAFLSLPPRFLIIFEVNSSTVKDFWRHLSSPCSHIPHGLDLNKLSTKLSRSSLISKQASISGLTQAAVRAAFLHLIGIVKAKNSDEIQAKWSTRVQWNNFPSDFINKTFVTLRVSELLKYCFPNHNDCCQLPLLSKPAY